MSRNAVLCQERDEWDPWPPDKPERQLARATPECCNAELIGADNAPLGLPS